MSLFGLLPEGAFDSAFQAGNVADAAGPVVPHHSWFQNLLGNLGDALSTSLDGKANYKEKLIGEQMQNYMSDPLGTIKGVAGIDPGSAQVLLKEYLANELAKTKDAREAAKDSREATSAKYTDQVNLGKIKDRVYGQVAGLLRDPNPATWAARKKVAQGIAQSAGIDLPIDIPDAYSEDVARQYHDTVVDPKDADTLAYRQAVLDERQNYHDQQIGLGYANRATRAAMDAARIGVSAANTGVAAANAGTAERRVNKGGTKDIGRPGVAASGAGPTKRFIIRDGKIQERQPDGNYK